MLGRFLSGFSSPERTPDGLAFAWSTRDAAVTVPDLDRVVPWLLRVRVSGAHPDRLDDRVLDISVDGVVVRSLPLPREWTDIAVPIEPRPDGRRGLRFGIYCASPFAPGGQDPRQLGATIAGVQIEPASTARGLPTLSALASLAAAGALVGLLLSAAGLGVRHIGAGIVLVAGMVAGLLSVSLAWHAGIVVDAARLAGLILSGATVLALVARVRADRWNAIAWAIGGVAVLAKILFVLHPAMTPGDTGFHLHRLETVLAGRYFFTSDAPGGSFPYPTAMYVIAGLFRPFVHDWIVFLRVAIAVVDGFAAYAVYSLVRRSWNRPTMALLAMIVYHLTPAGFQIQAVGYQSNGFGQAVAVLALVALLRVRASLAAAAGATVLLAVAFLAHLSSFLMTFAIAATTGVVLLRSHSPEARRLGTRILIVVGLATGLSVGLFYAHFPDTYRDLFAKLTSGRVAAQSAPAAIPVQRKEAHQTMYVPGWLPLRNRLAAIPGYVAKYLTWPLVLMALAGGRRLRRDAPVDEATKVLLAVWVGVSVGFLAIGQVSPLDLRYYLAIFPAMAVLAAVAVHGAWTAGGWQRGGAAALTVWFSTVSIAYWFAWFGPVVPK